MFTSQVYLASTFLLEANEDSEQITDFTLKGHALYSVTVENQIDYAVSQGFIKVQGKKRGLHEHFSITRMGKFWIQETIANLSPPISVRLAQKRIGWDQLGVEGIRNLISIQTTP